MVAVGSPAFADATPSVSTPLGTVVVESGLDSDSGLLSVTFTGAGPAGGSAPFSVTLDPRRGTLVFDTHRSDLPAPAAPRRPPAQASAGVPDAPGEDPILPCSPALAVLPDALPVAGCAPSDGFAGAPGLGAVALGTNRSSFLPGRDHGLPSSASGVDAPAAEGDGEESGGDSTLDAVNLALGVQHVNTGSAVGAQQASPVGVVASSATLAATGTPLLAGLAGLVLLVVGGVLTWKRVRD